ncbi:RasGTPase-activating protein [Cavenderia fasciculata]|uniref:RasGTPase-activating protein n=1 Tax=Cavenderia fasciculata TaxID=261658 RepID=F4PLF8_CACFS|nr:RasGTPase-activating protein [Cavenderia fasciculata]EGG23380.1 RasGTPase-activating protein [Cavenderia fasciculata]|eukprot:XP_004361231.1 RasGTPase-activating protein [Cavenderia fasciculata]
MSESILEVAPIQITVGPSTTREEHHVIYKQVDAAEQLQQQQAIDDSKRVSNTYVSPPSSPSQESIRSLKTKDCNVIIKVFEARALPEARTRKKDPKNNKSFKRAQSLLSEISSPNLMTFSDTTDPFCLVQIDKQRQRTRTIPKKLNPFWCEEFTMEVVDVNTDKIFVTVIDEKKYTNDDHIGKLMIPLNTLKDQKEREMWFPLQSPLSTKKVPQVQILFTFKPISLTDPNTPGLLCWKMMCGRNLGGSSNVVGQDNNTPFVNWSVRSKKGETIIEEENISWYTAVVKGVERELTESIDCVQFTLWKYEAKQSLLETAPLSARSRSTSGVITDSSQQQLTKSPELKSRSHSSAANNPPERLLTSALSQSSIQTTSGSSSMSSGTAPILSQSTSQPTLSTNTAAAAPNHHHLIPLPKNQSERFGDVRLKLKYTEEVVLPLESYQPLLSHLQQEDMSAVHILGNITKQREAVANNLIRVFEKTGHCLSLLKSLTEHEIDTTDNPDIIFRGNSLATKSVDLYMKLIGLPYLANTIGPLIKKIYVSKKSCEIDPTKLEKGEDAKKNAKNLLSWVKKMVSAILASADQCPGPLREIFLAIQTKVKQRYAVDHITQYTAVSGFIFLRFFCPSILAPKLFDLMPDHPGIKTTRSLILIAKTLQNLANLVELGVDYKEDFMRDMNRYVMDNMDGMKTFINSLATVPATCPPGQLLNPINLEKELACLYRHLIKQKDEMLSDVRERNNPTEIQSMLVLDTILEKLEKQVQYASTL